MIKQNSINRWSPLIINNSDDNNNTASSYNKYYVSISFRKRSNDFSINVYDKAALKLLDPEVSILYFEKCTGRKRAEEKLKNLRLFTSRKIRSIISKNNPDKLNLYFALLES